MNKAFLLLSYVAIAVAQSVPPPAETIHLANGDFELLGNSADIPGRGTMVRQLILLAAIHEAGILLLGAGTLWADDIRLVVQRSGDGISRAAFAYQAPA